VIKEFEGKTEKEAIDRAMEELGIDKEEFDVEIIETTRKGLIFKKGGVKIRIHTIEDSIVENKNEFETKIIKFLETLLKKMGCPGTVEVLFREERKVGFKITSGFSGILIGRKGKTIDALQLLTNIYANKGSEEKTKIIIDIENYRDRRKENLIKHAQKNAAYVLERKGSLLLEPMNPFERRLIHTALNDYPEIETKSEGEGLLKQVRIIYTEKKIG